jgi:hypothetical protein
MLRDSDVLVEINVLDSLDHIHAFFEGTLEGFAAKNETHTSGSFVDDGCEDRIFQVGVALAFAATVDKAYATVVAVEDLVTGEVVPCLVARYPPLLVGNFCFMISARRVTPR